MTITRIVEFDIHVVIHRVGDHCYVYRFRREEMLQAVAAVNYQIAAGKFGFPDGKLIVKAIADACKTQ